MNLQKISKKTPHIDSRQTLIALHNQKLETIGEYYKTVDKKKERLDQLKKIALSLPTRVSSSEFQKVMQKRENIENEINDLIEEIRNIELKTEELEYVSKSALYIEKYYEYKNREESEIKKKDNTETDTKENVDDQFIENMEMSSFITEKNISKKGILCEEYAINCLGIIHHGNKLQKKYQEEINRPLVCEECNINRELIVKEGIAVCVECGDVAEYSDQINNVEFNDEVQIISKFSYKKINHFKEWLQQLQARETSKPSQDIIDLLLLELKKDRITDTKDITRKRIKGYLKKLGLNKQYEHIPSIINKLCGITPSMISKNLQNKLISMFHEIQIPFKNHCPPNRKNFLSYSYTLYKMCQLLGEDDLLPCFQLLKSREKLYLQDTIWKGICSDLNWKFYPSL